MKVMNTATATPSALLQLSVHMLAQHSVAKSSGRSTAVAMITGGGGGGGGGGVDMGSIGKGMAGLVGRSAASGDVGGKSQKIKMPSMGGSKKAVTRAPSGTAKV